MNEFLKKLKLIDYLTISLPITKHEFVKKLSTIIDDGGAGLFSEPFEGLSKSENEYRGQVDFDGFKIRRRRKLIDTNFNLATASGTFSEEKGQLTITTEINGFNNLFIVFYIFLFVFYFIFFISFGFWDSNTRWIIFPFILIHGIFMAMIPYYMMRRSVKRMKYELESELYFLTKGER